MVLSYNFLRLALLEGACPELFVSYTHLNARPFAGVTTFDRNLTPRQRELIEEFAKEEQGEYDKRAAAGASG